jgi:osmotically-inducible protein OsmY
MRHLFRGRRPATAVLGISLAFTAVQQCRAEDKVGTFNGYVDTDICSRLMLGPISESRMGCSKDTLKQGATSVIVRIADNLVFDVNKTKMINPLISQMVSATGELKEKDGRMKLQEVAPLPAGAVKPGTPGYELLDVRHFKLTGETAKVQERVRHEIAMMPYITEYDFISFTMGGDRVILTGWTVRQTNRSTAFNLAKNVEGVGSVTNNIEVLPLGRMDMQIRAGVRAVLQRVLSRYFWSSGSAIKIVVKNGDVILLGMVHSEADVNLANIQANSVPGVFKVFNMLRVEAKETKSSD